MGSLERIELRNTEDDSARELEVDGTFIAIGHIPNSQLVEGQVKTDENGYVITEGKSTRTGVPGVFAAGDLVDHTYRQAVTAAEVGCQAALDRVVPARHAARGLVAEARRDRARRRAHRVRRAPAAAGAHADVGKALYLAERPWRSPAWSAARVDRVRMDTIVIAGGGLAAQKCAETLGVAGYEGAIRMVCGEPVRPYDRPPLSKEALSSASGRVPPCGRRPGIPTTTSNCCWGRRRRAWSVATSRPRPARFASIVC